LTLKPETIRVDFNYVFVYRVIGVVIAVFVVVVAIVYKRSSLLLVFFVCVTFGV